MRSQTRKLQQPDLFGGTLEEKQEVRRAGSDRQWSVYGDLIPKFLGSCRSQVTRNAYSSDFSDFFGGQPTAHELGAFLTLDEAQLTQRMMAYRKHLLSRRLSHSTVKRRLTALRSLLKYAYGKGLSRTNGHTLSGEDSMASVVTAEGELDDKDLARLLAEPGTTTLRGIRDTALFHVLVYCALHRSQLCVLDVADYRVRSRELIITPKMPRGRVPPVPIELPLDSAQALDAYLEAAGHRGQAKHPLFCNVDRRSHGGNERLSADGIYYLISHYGKLIELPALNSRHLRHAAIAAALKAASGDEKRVHEQLGHISLSTLYRHKSRSSAC